MKKILTMPGYTDNSVSVELNDINKMSPEDIYNSGVEALNKNELNLAEERFKYLLGTESRNYFLPPNINCKLGRTYLSLEKYDEAIEELLEALNKINCGIKFDCNRFLSDKHESNERLIAKTYHDLGIAFLMQKDFFKSRLYLMKSLDMAKNIQGLESWFRNDLGWLYYEWGKYDDAESQYDFILYNLERNNPHTYTYKGITLYKKGDHYNSRVNFDMALDIFDKKMRKFENNQSNTDQLEAKIRLNLRRAVIFINISRIFLDENNFIKAEENLEKALNIFDDSREYINNLIPIRKTKQYKNIASIHNNLGLSFYKQSLTDAAEREFQVAMKYDKSATIYNNLANIYADYGQVDRAEKLYRIALTIDPKFEPAHKNLKILRGYIGATQIDWWDWWFKDGYTLQENKKLWGYKNLVGTNNPWINIRKVVGSFLMISLIITISDIILVEMGFFEGFSNLTSMSYKFITALFIFVILISPQLKSFSVGSVRLELVEKATDSKGASSR